MILKRIYTDEFDALFNGTIILDIDIENKLHLKHKVYQDDLEDALGDPYRVVLKPKQSSKTIANKSTPSGHLFEVLCETTSSKILLLL